MGAVRVALVVRGTVQGVGFRPFVRRAARALGLSGWVRNGRDAVRIEVEGDARDVEAFCEAVAREPPPAARIVAIERRERPAPADRDERDGDGDGRERDGDGERDGAFRILPSAEDAAAAPVLPPDLATCDACLRDVAAPDGRRRGYAFTSCASCGPRYSIALALPYDRKNTTMASFAMCEACASEYGDVDDRRYHAQPIACARCGPTLAWVAAETETETGAEPIARALEVLAQGGVVAVRGLGGFQLLCDATSDAAVRELRARKRRPDKPFAVMFRDRDDLARSALVTSAAARALASPEAPIVLVDKRAGARVLSDAVAPGSPWIGAMLPYTPLHALLLRGARGPLVCTSGNVSEEPICTSNEEAFERLASIADGFLCHDRPIVRPLDDSLVRASERRAVVLRRARGYAPRAVARLPAEPPAHATSTSTATSTATPTATSTATSTATPTATPTPTVLALGAHLKSTVTLAHQGSLVASQHLGDLASLESRDLLRRTALDLCAFFDAKPNVLACDLHPEYASTRLAEELARVWDLPLVRVQHHHAHVAACMAEHGVPPDEEVLGLAWDGTGFGLDGAIWGGEALLCRGARFERFAHLRPFPLPGGDLASRDPRRAALGLLFEAMPRALDAFARPWFGPELPLHVRALERRVNAPVCTSVGRLFDAIAALLGEDRRASFEGQRAMALEALAATAPADGGRYALPVREARAPGDPLVADTAPLLAAIVAELRAGADRARVARRFHESLVELGATLAALAARARGVSRVALTGGCFQNALLAERLEERLARDGFTVLVPTLVPANDGGISVGQAWIAALGRRSR
jgi:hydrogenase maturation protein HypF